MSTASANVTLFDDEFLKKLEYLNIISKRLFAGQNRAERRTRKRGTGLEFADYRAVCVRATISGIWTGRRICGSIASS